MLEEKERQTSETGAQEFSGVQRELELNGYSVREFNGYVEFTDFLGQLGESINVTRIAVDESERALLNSKEAMPFHTDSPVADLIAWYCEGQSEKGGASLLADSRSVLEELDEREVERLRHVLVKYPVLDDGERRFRLHPLLSESRIYYAPWLVGRDLQDTDQAALKHFEHALHNLALIKVRLREGMGLIIDNRRVLHGRERVLQQTRRRCLVRHWIRRLAD